MLTSCIWSGVCGAASRACTPDVATVENCGFIASVAEKNKKKGCSMAFQCGCNVNGNASGISCSCASCVSGISVGLKCAQIGCSHIGGELSKKKSVTEILLEQVRLHGGYYVGDDPWYKTITELVPNADELEKAESVAWRRFVTEKFVGRMM